MSETEIYILNEAGKMVLFPKATYRAEIERLRKALEKIVALDPLGLPVDYLGRAARIAREALHRPVERGEQP